MSRLSASRTSPDHQPVRPHPQGFLDEPAQRDFAFAFQVRLPALQAHNVTQRKLQFEDFLNGDDPLTGADPGGKAVQHGGFAGLGRPGHQDVQSAGHRGTEEPCGLRSQRAELHQVFKPAGLDDELADVDGPVPPGDVGNDDVEPGSVGQGGINER